MLSSSGEIESFEEANHGFEEANHGFEEANHG
jgi:hypothetical protein